MIRRCGIALLLTLLATSGWAEDPVRRQELASIRERIVALDLEAALASISRLLEQPGLTEDERAEALALRAGAHVAAGELDAVERDYEAIVTLRPEFEPDPAFTSTKATERLRRVRARTIATLQLDIDPRDARLSVDDRPVVTSSGTLRVRAGERRLRAERVGFDALEVSVSAVAGAETLLKLQLVPNARGILVRTDIPGVAVFVDGEPAGETVGTDRAAQLLVPDLPIGEHTIELRKPCFASESVPALVSVDLADRSPKPLALVTMRPAAARITAKGADHPGELRIDGARLSALPTESFTVCPGPRTIEVVASRRVVWSGTIEADETDRTLDLSPRPNVVLVGDEWPEEWRDFAGAVSLRGRVDPGPERDLSTLDGWRGLVLPADTDIAVAVRSPRVFVYAPALDALAPADAPPRAERPVWTGARIDAELIDHGGSVLVGTVRPGGAADRVGLAPGDRVLAVGTTAVATVTAARLQLDGLHPASVAALRVASPGREPRVVSVPVAADPRIVVPRDPVDAIVRGAFAAAEGAAGGPRAASALANLATALEARGHPGMAVEAWRRAKALDPASFAVRADYAAAADLAARGKSAEAREMLGRVRESADSAGELTISAAAGDRLADLGVAP